MVRRGSGGALPKTGQPPSKQGVTGRCSSNVQPWAASTTICYQLRVVYGPWTIESLGVYCSGESIVSILADNVKVRRYVTHVFIPVKAEQFCR